MSFYNPNRPDYKCCICGKTFNDYGNNPAPVNNEPDARCCDMCNKEAVIPARIKLWLLRKNTNSKEAC